MEEVHWDVITYMTCMPFADVTLGLYVMWLATCMQDGYHYSIAYLQTMDNPDDKIYRRGAPDTFDAAGLKRDLGRIKNGDEEIVSIPGFDHAKGDPEPDAHVFQRSEHKIVICEGLYLVHDADGWEGIASLFDMTIFISSDVDMCIDRLKIRNKCIPGESYWDYMYCCFNYM